MRRASLLVAAALGLLLAPEASAHAEITPSRVPANGVSTFVLSVAGEEASPTVRIAVQLPAGMEEVEPANARGWQANRAGRVITWTGGSIQQGDEGTFEVTARFPNTPGERLAFPTVQTYGNGTVVRWIGAPSSDTPAPTILLTVATQPPPPPPPPPATQPPPPPPPVTTTTNAPSQDEDDGSTGWLVGAVLIVILVGAAVALLWRRRRP
jgi:uncharacterized protein YcnI